MTGAVCALDAMGSRDEWTDWEREIVEWMESDKWKPNAPAHRESGAPDGCANSNQGE